LDGTKKEIRKKKKKHIHPTLAKLITIRKKKERKKS